MENKHKPLKHFDCQGLILKLFLFRIAKILSFFQFSIFEKGI